MSYETFDVHVTKTRVMLLCVMEKKGKTVKEMTQQGVSHGLSTRMDYCCS